MKYSIAIAIPWFGKEMKGGAETLAYHLAQGLASVGHQVTILTTISQSHAAFFGANEVPKGRLVEENDGPLRILKFPVNKRSPRLFHRQNKTLMSLRPDQFNPGLPPLHPEQESLFWKNNIRSTELVDYIKGHYEAHDFFIFLPYPFSMVLDGVKAAGKKALLQPCLHDESYAYLSEVFETFLQANWLLFNSRGEADVAMRLFGPTVSQKSTIVGTGVEVDVEALAQAPRLDIEGEYVLYIGKRDAQKNVDQLLLAHQAYQRQGGTLKLVLAGSGTLPVEVDDVVDMGLVSESQKLSLLRHAKALINPSVNESFSRVIFESWYAKRPVVVHRDCEASYGFLQDSDFGGYAYREESGLVQQLFDLEKATQNDLDEAGMRGFDFAQKFAQWDQVLNTYESVFAKVTELNSPANRPAKQSRRVVQLLPDLAKYDAVGNQTQFLQTFFEEQGYESLIMAYRRPLSLSKKAEIFKPGKIKSTDTLILHHSIGGGSQVECFKAHPGKKYLIYHNITPDHFFEPYAPGFADILRKGREELAALATATPIALGDSKYNQEELAELGFERSEVLPLMIKPSTWAIKPDPEVAQKMAQMGGKHLLFVGRISPNKCQTDLVKLIGALAQTREQVHLWLVGGFDNHSKYLAELNQLIDQPGIKGKITVTGSVDQSALMAYYMNADLFLSMSEHEGFGVPLVEAAWFDLPVFAYASSAVPETLGEAGFTFTNKTNLPQLAQEVEAILADTDVQQRMCQLQRKNRVRFLPEQISPLYQEIFQPNDEQARPKVAFAVQRCGKDIVGGAEALCLQVATQLSQHVDVDILASCAKEYTTWEDHYPAGVERLSPSLRIIRFPVKQPRNRKKFDRFTGKIFQKYQPGKLLEVDTATGEKWLRQQGPEMPSFLEFLQDNQQDYEALFFYCYLYYQSYFGTQVCPEKSWLVALAHDEPVIYLSIFDSLVSRVRGVIHNTPGEAEIISERFAHLDFQSESVGAGLTPPEEPGNQGRFVEKFAVEGPFVLYIGRIEPSKGSDLLFDCFTRYKADNPGPLQLLLIGKTEVSIPKHPDIRYLGYVEDQEKHDALAACELLINPSPYESLSMILLEAWYNKKPVLVNQHCAVLVDQTKRAQGGGWFADYGSFQEALNKLLSDPFDGEISKGFVEEHYTWPAIEQRYLQLIKQTKAISTK